MMTFGKWPFVALMAVVPLGVGLAAPEEDADARLTRPTRITLDFKNRPVSEVVKTIAQRSGKRISALGRMMTKNEDGIVRLGGPRDRSWLERRVTLESPEPVPFWEGIDRFAEVSRLVYHQGETSDPGADSVNLLFDGEGDPPSPASYAGPFRVGLLGVHEHKDLVFVHGPWVRFYPSTVAVRGTAADLVSAPKDGGPRYVELDVAVEPGLIALRNGPLQDVEAVDEAGRSLLAPPKEDVRQWFQAFAFTGGGIAPVVRIPLRPSEAGEQGGKASIQRLRGKIPVELARLKPRPALVIPLGSAEGKTFEGGGVAITVETARTEPDGRTRIAYSCRLLDEKLEPFPRSARLAVLRGYQLSLLDARGAVAASSSGSSGGGSTPGTLAFSYEYAPIQQPNAALRLPPTELRYYDLDRVQWQIPFEFRDVPLP